MSEKSSSGTEAGVSGIRPKSDETSIRRRCKPVGWRVGQKQSFTHTVEARARTCRKQGWTELKGRRELEALRTRLKA